jgi:hypothetical protein
MGVLGSCREREEGVGRGGAKRKWEEEGMWEEGRMRGGSWEVGRDRGAGQKDEQTLEEKRERVMKNKMDAIKVARKKRWACVMKRSGRKRRAWKLEELNSEQACRNEMRRKDDRKWQDKCKEREKRREYNSSKLSERRERVSLLVTWNMSGFSAKQTHTVATAEEMFSIIRENVQYPASRPNDDSIVAFRPFKWHRLQ